MTVMWHARALARSTDLVLVQDLFSKPSLTYECQTH